MKPREVRRREAWCWGLGTLRAVAGLLLLYGLCEGMPTAEGGTLGPWIGASIGAGMTHLLTRRQRREEEARQRRTLATMLLQELRLLEIVLLEIVLKDINDSFELDMEGVALSHGDVRSGPSRAVTLDSNHGRSVGILLSADPYAANGVESVPTPSSRLTSLARRRPQGASDPGRAPHQRCGAVTGRRGGDMAAPVPHDDDSHVSP